MKWETVELKDVCAIKSGKRLPKGHDFSASITPFPYIRARDIKDGRIDDSNLAYISYDTKKKINKYIVNSGDIVVTIVGASTGDIAFVAESFNGYNLTENAVRLTEFADCVKPKFLFYSLYSETYRSLMQRIAGGSAQAKLGIYKIEKIKIDLPPFETQKRIADILSAYDDLIENNQKQIKLLEEAAQRLYKEWFIDLHFPSHENTPIINGIPKGWGYVSLNQLVAYEIGGGWGSDTITNEREVPAYVIRGTDLYDLTHGNYNGIPYRYHSKTNLMARALQDGDIIFEVSGGSKTEGVARTVLIRRAILEQFGGQVMCASFCKLMRPANAKMSQYLYDTFLYLRSSGETAKYDKRSASSIVNYRWKDFLEQQMILVPSEVVLEKYYNLSGNIYQKILSCSRTIQTAKIARDRLLPKLMSGEIEV